MANRNLISYLISSLKRRGLIPTADETFATADFLALIDDEIRTYCVPILKEIHEEYLIRRVSQAVTSGTASYAMPQRASAETLKMILVDDGSGTYVPLNRVEPENAYRYTADATTGTVAAFYLEDDCAVLVPTPRASTTIQWVYYNRPNRVVELEEVAEILTINTTTKRVTIDGLPEDFVNLSSGGSDTYDLVSANPGFRSLAMDVTAVESSTLGPTVYGLTFAATLPTRLAVGDYVCLAGESPIAQIPLEMHPLLAQRVCFVIQEAEGDPHAAAAEKTLEKMEVKLRSMLGNRVEAASRPLQNFFAPGWGR